jgi:hypothetical protein
VSKWLLNDDPRTVRQTCRSKLLDDIGEQDGRNRQIVRRMEVLPKGHLEPRKGVGILVVPVDVLQPGQELVESPPVVDTPCSVLDAIAGPIAQLRQVPI